MHLLRISDITEVRDRDEITSENNSAVRAEVSRIFEEDCRKNKIDISKRKSDSEAFKTIYREGRNYWGRSESSSRHSSDKLHSSQSLLCQ